MAVIDQTLSRLTSLEPVEKKAGNMMNGMLCYVMVLYTVVYVCISTCRSVKQWMNTYIFN